MVAFYTWTMLKANIDLLKNCLSYACKSYNHKLYKYLNISIDFNGTSIHIELVYA